jgi:hypothetical protein
MTDHNPATIRALEYAMIADLVNEGLYTVNLNGWQKITAIHNRTELHIQPKTLCKFQLAVRDGEAEVSGGPAGEGFGIADVGKMGAASL